MALLVAEIGQNHCGEMKLARELIRRVKENGGDLVKFQLYDSKKLYGKKQVEELTFDQAKMLFEFGETVGIEVFFSVFNVERIKWCEEIGVKRYKIACSQVKNIYLIQQVFKTKKPIIISTPELHGGACECINLCCVPKYPADIKEYDLDNLDCYDGVSDHTIGIELAKETLKRGLILEKHFAIDHQTGVDAEWSMTPDELRELKRWEQICVQLS